MDGVNMIIQTVKKKYLVIGYLEKDGQKETFLCENVADHSRCLIIRIKDQQLISAVVEFLYEQAANEAFTDFKDCFVSEESLALVFSHCEGQELDRKIGGEYSGLEERLEIVKKALERIILLDMPLFFACRCLRVQNIFVKRSLDVSFCYSIDGIAQNNACSMKEVQDCLREVMEFVFKEELKKEVIRPMEVFLDVLSQKQYDGYLELYRSFLFAKDQVLALSKQELEVPKTWIFRMWDKVRKLFKPMKRILVIAVLIAGLLYMLWTIDSMSKPASSSKVVDQIGTLKIQ
ncbi:MAG: hypothetical protein LBS02_15690 [Hungatella sp.]|jgi:hypothetical protein|nr:hypothetical protein [Hungatella sp.]